MLAACCHQAKALVPQPPRPGDPRGTFDMEVVFSVVDTPYSPTPPVVESRAGRASQISIVPAAIRPSMPMPTNTGGLQDPPTSEAYVDSTPCGVARPGIAWHRRVPNVPSATAGEHAGVSPGSRGGVGTHTDLQPTSARGTVKPATTAVATAREVILLRVVATAVGIRLSESARQTQVRANARLSARRPSTLLLLPGQIPGGGELLLLLLLLLLLHNRDAYTICRT
ncbi:hypothetical protein LY78DRAFT_29219 [Colletotrichum sublineola]|nr:hypothetical protein LY78DRAFT_29219 [Colletotrichum sublineola]